MWAPALRQLSFYLPASKLILKWRFALLQNSESLILSGTMGWRLWKCISDSGRTCICKTHPPPWQEAGNLKEDIAFTLLTRSWLAPTQGHTSKSSLWLLITKASFPRTLHSCVNLRWVSPLWQQKEPNLASGTLGKESWVLGGNWRSPNFWGREGTVIYPTAAWSASKVKRCLS